MKEDRRKKLAKKLGIILDEDGRSVLNMKVGDDSSFLSPFYFDRPLISDEAASYLSSHKAILLWKQGAHINIISDSISEEDEPIYRTAVKGYFAQEAIRWERAQRRNYILSAVLFLIGVAVFALMFTLDHYLGGALGMWSEVIDVVAWVFIWEAVDVAFIEKLENSYNVRMAHNLINSRIEFKPISKPGEGKTE